MSLLRSNFVNVEGWNIRGKSMLQWKPIYVDAIGKLMTKCSHPMGFTHWRMVDFSYYPPELIGEKEDSDLFDQIVDSKFHKFKVDTKIIYISPTGDSFFDKLTETLEISTLEYDIRVNVHTRSNPTTLKGADGLPAYQEKFQYSIFVKDLLKVFTQAEISAYGSGIL